MVRWNAARMRPGRWDRLPVSVDDAAYRSRSAWDRVPQGRGDSSFFGKFAPYKVARFAARGLGLEAVRRAYVLGKRVYKTKYVKKDITKYKQIFGKGSLDAKRVKGPRPWVQAFKYSNMK